MDEINKQIQIQTKKHMHMISAVGISDIGFVYKWWRTSCFDTEQNTTLNLDIFKCI